ncbi:Hypothetical protein NTJ_00051 [Nesidiocoris tenuis]|uniref:Apple domain-containing protein n=1 Tax=Nesidiocoris tenuis TaxID=355587 RepID=A0ABN7A502_9HEMI|nr:Hypothetical protein NTJ_00051 [Nesidiocoris tenuis]
MPPRLKKGEMVMNWGNRGRVGPTTLRALLSRAMAFVIVTGAFFFNAAGADAPLAIITRFDVERQSRSWDVCCNDCYVRQCQLKAMTLKLDLGGEHATCLFEPTEVETFSKHNPG